MSAALHLRAYAKLNLTLLVDPPRADGYHPLDSVVQQIALCDEITLRPTSQGDRLSVDGDELPTDGRNLALAAAQTLRTAVAPGAPGCEIVLRKQIPIGAGLGGGSADAAAVLRGLNRFWDCGLNTQELVTLAARLGADVPVCLVGGTCRMQGIGERVTRLAAPTSLWVVVANPGHAVSTRAVYAAFDALPPPSPGDNGPAVAALARGDWPALSAACRNDLNPAAVSVCPAIEQAARALQRAGAERALMTGSGSAVFALFGDADSAERVWARVRDAVPWSWWGPACRPD